jgi:stage II sporulation protein AA (anti-sigma F factor antagonist)
MSDAPAPTSVQIEISGSAIIARVQVKLLDDKELKLLSQMIDQTAGTGGITVVVVDMSRVHFVPSLGLGVLIQMSAKCKARQQRLKLAAVLPSVRQVFTITRLDRVLELTDTVETALEGNS